MQYLYAPFCKSCQKPKSRYILAGAGFVKMAGFRPELELKSGTALISRNVWHRKATAVLQYITYAYHTHSHCQWRQGTKRDIRQKMLRSD